MKSSMRKPTKIAMTALAASLFGLVSSGAMAQSGPAQNFDQDYLDSHPGVAHELAKDPSLVENQQYLTNHPQLQSYLTAHPNVAQDLKNHPYRFMRREDQANGWHPGAAGQNPNATGDQSRDSNPEVAQKLNQNPNLAHDQQFLAQHPDAKQFMENHPNARYQWRSHPHRFMAHVRHYRQTH